MVRKPFSNNNDRENKTSHEIAKEKIYAFLVSLLLTLIFTLALFTAVWDISWIINTSLKPIFPDYGPIPYNRSSMVNAIRPIGYACFGATVLLILVGFLIKRSKITLTGSVAFFLPIFGHFAMSMFIFAGIGIFRIVWMPLFDVPILSIDVLSLGDIVMIPNYLLAIFGAEVLSFIYDQISPGTYRISAFDLLEFITTMTMVIGIGIFVFSTISWFYGKFSDDSSLDVWIYKYSRHPQYLGLLLWSYGLMNYVGFQPHCGGYVPPPTFPWLLFACLVIGVALQEEIRLGLDPSCNYLDYRTKTPFLFPLPHQVSTFLSLPMKLLLKKDWPETSREGILIWIIYSAFFVFLSLLTVDLFGKIKPLIFHLALKFPK